MTRRALFALAAAALLDPERLLWKPGKLISIPKPRPVVPIIYVSGDIIMANWDAPFAQELSKRMNDWGCVIHEEITRAEALERWPATPLPADRPAPVHLAPDPYPVTDPAAWAAAAAAFRARHGHLHDRLGLPA